VSLTGLLAFAINLSIFWIIGNTSPMTYVYIVTIIIIIMSLIKPIFAQAANALCHVSMSNRNTFIATKILIIHN